MNALAASDLTMTAGSSGDPLARSGATVIINADDWGRDCAVTDRTLECVRAGAVSSVSAMVFMQDSERAANLAREHRVDAGLHLNLTTPFSGVEVSASLRNHQQKLTGCLRRHSFAPALYHPTLGASFEYVVKAQIEEYERLYDAQPMRLDGHHHMHLCTNVLAQKLLPAGTITRRNFSFARGEKSALNRAYRRWQDGLLARRHRMTDFFFSLPPMDIPGRLERIFEMAARFQVEVETHLVNEEEYRFLLEGELGRRLGDVMVARGYAVA